MFSDFLFLYSVGVLWSAASWMRQVHETASAAELCSNRTTEKNRKNTLKKSAQKTFGEGIWCIPFWPLLIIRNLRSVIFVAKERWFEPKNETQRRQ